MSTEQANRFAKTVLVLFPQENPIELSLDSDADASKVALAFENLGCGVAWEMHRPYLTVSRPTQAA